MQQYIKEQHITPRWSFIPGIQSWFNVPKGKEKLICYVNRLKMENDMVISLCTAKASDKINGKRPQLRVQGQERGSLQKGSKRQLPG